MLKKVLKSIVACSLAVGLLIGSGNEVVQAKVKGYSVHDCRDDNYISCCNHYVKVFYEGQEAYLLFDGADSVDKESPDSDWGYANVLIVSTINEKWFNDDYLYYTDYKLYYGPMIVVGLDGNKILDGAVVYKITEADKRNAFDSDDTNASERLQRSTPYLKSCDFDLRVIYEW